MSAVQKPKFRTRSGQTGTDAYIYEASQIANCQRELDERMRRLCEVIHEEAPETFKYSTDYHPRLGVNGGHARALSDYILKVVRSR